MCTIDYPDFIIRTFMENSISLKGLERRTIACDRAAGTKLKILITC